MSPPDDGGRPRDDVLRDEVRALLEGARHARADGDDDGRCRVLEEAVAGAVRLGEPALLQAACWRLAKARHDQGRHDALLDALAPLLAPLHERSVWGTRRTVGPFDHYAAGLDALVPVVRAHQDALGYRDPRVEQLWTAWEAAQEERPDAVLRAWGRTQRAWAWACTGQLAPLTELVQRHARLHPRDLDGARSRHPRARGAEDSLGWIQLDGARTLLRAATWAGDEALAWQAQELLEDAAEEVGLDRHADGFWLDALLRAAERFGWEVPRTAYGPAYAALAASGGLPGAHALRAAAWLARDRGEDGVPLAAAAAEALAAARAGPEWVVEAWHEAGRPDEARRVAEVHGVAWSGGG
ncbi:MAG: hypothetical protein H6732_15400 [Alphaproteobacteria bacterium]|nr:hypothetical protein [Alphaproteobacteria bacterium]